MNAMKRRITAMLLLAMVTICAPAYALKEKQPAYSDREASPGEADPDIGDIFEDDPLGDETVPPQDGDDHAQENNVFEGADISARNASAPDAADGSIFGSAKFTGSKKLVAKLYDANNAYLDEAILGSSGDGFSFGGLRSGMYMIRFYFYGEGSLPESGRVRVEVGCDTPSAPEEEPAETIVVRSVTTGENVITVSGNAKPGAQVMITTQPAAAATVYAMADETGSFSAAVSCAAGVYTRVTVSYSGDPSSAVSLSGNFIVSAPNVRPEITIDPIHAASMTVAARTGAGVLVEIRTEDYSQRLSADGEGLVQFSLPHTYPKGTQIAFRVFYGTNNTQHYDVVVAVSDSVYLGRLKKGSRGEAVRTLTTRLHELGYPVKPTTYFDSTVERAVKLFQELNGLSVTGEAGQGTQGKLFSVSAIRYGETRYPTFVRGDRDHPLIYALQQRLKELGYYMIKVDGIFGSGTQRAVRDFQRMNGLTVTGKADDATQRLLHSEAAQPANIGVTGEYRTLKRSSKYQSAVVPLQKRLKALGYYSGSIDGYFGSGTYRAVRNFQQRNGLEKTGVADPHTQKVLYSADAQPAGVTSSSVLTPAGYRLLYWGCKGSDVKRLQNALISAGYKRLVRTADGVYGQWTYDAVCAFQRDRGLTVDGVAGRDTQNALYGTNY